jgi:hypothetical protein
MNEKLHRLVFWLFDDLAGTIASRSSTSFNDVLCFGTNFVLAVLASLPKFIYAAGNHTHHPFFWLFFIRILAFFKTFYNQLTKLLSA